jgi:hypothetical protein
LATFALTAAAACGGEASAAVTIDQAPILHVVRTSDLLTSKNVELPSGALTASQLAQNFQRSGSAARAQVRLLLAGGFRSSAISAFEGPGRMTWTSSAAELGSPAQACKAVAPQARLDARSLSPPGDHTAISPDTNVPHSRIVTYTPPHASWAGGVEIVTCAGDYVYILRDIGKPAAIVTQQRVEALLTTVIARTG